MRILAVVVILVGLFSAFSSECAAQSEEELRAQELFLEGVKLFREKKYAQANDVLMEAYRIDESPILIFNLARVNEEAGEFRTALNFFKMYLAKNPAEGGRRDAETRIAAIEKEMSLAKVRLFVSPQGAAVRFDGKDVGVAPIEPIRASSGHHAVKVFMEGYEEWEGDVSLKSGEIEEIHVQLVRAKGIVVLESDQADLRETTLTVDGVEVTLLPEERLSQQTEPRTFDVGRHVLLCQKQGIPNYSVPFEVKTGQAARIRCQFEMVIPKPQSSTWGWVTLGSGLASVAVGAGFLTRYLIDYSNYEGETKTKEADIFPPDNAIAGAVFATVGVGLSLASIFLFPEQVDREEAGKPAVGIFPILVLPSVGRGFRGVVLGIEF